MSGTPNLLFPMRKPGRADTTGTPGHAGTSGPPTPLGPGVIFPEPSWVIASRVVGCW